MSGRKNPDLTEAEKKRDYRRMQKRGYGETLAGEEGSFLDEMGPAAEVARQREAWQKEAEKRSPGLHAPPMDEP